MTTQKKGNKMQGFTLIEMLIALAVFSIVGVATTGMLYSALTWGDRVRTLEEVEEGERILDRTLRRAILNSTAMTESPEGTLLLTGADECWSFVYRPLAQRIDYARVVASGCLPDTNPTESLLPEIIVTGVDFDLTDFETGGRQLHLDAHLERAYPLGSYERDIEITVLNYLINEL